MKRILLLGTILFSVMTANAAVYQWKTGYGASIYNSAGTTIADGTIVSLYAFTIPEATSGSSILIDTATITGGTFSKTTSENTDLTIASKYNFYFVIEDGSSMFTSALLSTTVPDNGKTVTLTFTKNGYTAATQTASNWTTAAVPEPTSGLLLLCGLAGLALRRKRA